MTQTIERENGARVLKAQPEDEYFFAEGCFILELSNRADDPAVSIARARLEAGKTTRLHELDAVVERYVILAGRGEVCLDRGGEHELRAEVGAEDVVIIPPGVSQNIRNSGSEDLLFLAICSPRFTPECYRDVEDV